MYFYIYFPGGRLTYDIPVTTSLMVAGTFRLYYLTADHWTANAAIGITCNGSGSITKIVRGSVSASDYGRVHWIQFHIEGRAATTNYAQLTYSTSAVTRLLYGRFDRDSAYTYRDSSSLSFFGDMHCTATVCAGRGHRLLHRMASLSSRAGSSRPATPEILVSGASVAAGDGSADETAAAEVARLLSVRQVRFRCSTPVTAFIYTTDGTTPAIGNGTRIAAAIVEEDSTTGALTWYAADWIDLKATATVKVVALGCYTSATASALVEVRACLNLTIAHSTAEGWTDTFQLVSTLASAPQLEYLWYSDAEGLVWKPLPANTAITAGSQAVTSAMPAETTTFFRAHGVFVRAAAGSANVFWTSATARAHWSTSVVGVKGDVRSLIDAAWWTDTVLALSEPYQFAGLFEGCTGITSVPRLSALTPTVGCYQRMFAGCTGITSAEIMLATTAADCCAEMFDGAGSLAKVRVHWAHSSWPTGATDNWLRDVASDGEFIFDTNAPLADEDRSASTVPAGWNYWDGHLGRVSLMVADATEISSGNIEAD